MATPNFDPKQYIDPASLSGAFQNKAQIEEQMRNNKFNRLIQAVKTGQDIAGGMMDFAEKRQQQKGIDKAQQLITTPNSRPEELKAALLQAGGKEAALKMLQNEHDKRSTASQMSVDKLSVKFKGEKERKQVMGNIDKLNRRVYDLAGNDITDQIEDAAPAFAPMAVEQGGGGYEFRERTPGTTASTKDAAIPPEKVGTVTSFAQLEKRDRDVVLGQLNEAKADPLITDSRKALKSLDLMRKAINDNNKAIIDRMGGLFHKTITLDVGNLAAYEQRDPNSRQLWDRIKNAGSLWIKGVPADSVRAEILGALDAAEGTITGTMDDAFSFRADALTQQFPQLNRDAILKQMGSGSINRKAKDAAKEADEFFKSFIGK